MTCDCGSTETRLSYRAGRFSCRTCARLPSVTVPDVYFKGAYLDRNLVDVYKPEQKDGVWIESRRQKAEIMERLGVREMGDKQHGARNEDRAAQRRERDRFGR